MRSEQRRRKLASPTERLAQFRRVTAEPDQIRWREGGRVPRVRHVRASPIPERKHDVEYQ